MDVQYRSSLNRRQFMAGIGGALAAMGLTVANGASGALIAGGSAQVPAGKSGRADVALVFCDDAGTAGKRQALVQTVVTRACPSISFDIHTVRDSQCARDVIGRTTGVDGYLVWVFGRRGAAARAFARSGRPVVLAVDPAIRV